VSLFPFFKELSEVEVKRERREIYLGCQKRQAELNNKKILKVVEILIKKM
jgi:hypothetical protein